MTQAFVIRKATAGDIPVIVRHRRLMFESMGFCDAARNDELDRMVFSQLADAIPAGEYHGWMAVAESGVLAAGAGLSVVRGLGTPRNAEGIHTYLMSLYVEPAYRRRGIARRLIETMIDWSRERGIHEIRLHASAEGRPLYESLGFRQTNEMRLLLPEQ